MAVGWWAKSSMMVTPAAVARTSSLRFTLRKVDKALAMEAGLIPCPAANAAAAVAVIALCVGLYYVRQSPAVVAASVAALPLSANKPLVVVERYSFATVREATQTPVLDLPSGGALELRALTSATGGGRTFRATLEEIRGEEPFRLGAAEHLAPDADGFVAIYADTSHLQPGDYLLIVQSDVEDKTSAERFAFRLKRPAGATPEGH